MPNVANLIDEVRALFPSAKVTYAKDQQTGVEVGRRASQEGFQIPPNYGPSTPLDPKKGKRQ